MEKYALRAELLKHSQVPPYSHQLTTKGLFVFAALEHFCGLALKSNPRASLKQIIPQALEQAYLDPFDAVHNWYIHPNHLNITSVNDQFALYHPALNARIARLFQDVEQAEKAMADILRGATIQADDTADFMFDNQPFVFCYTLPSPDELVLPAMPDGAHERLDRISSIPAAFRAVLPRVDLQHALMEQAEVITNVHPQYLTIGCKVVQTDWNWLSNQHLENVAKRVSATLPNLGDTLSSPMVKTRLDVWRAASGGVLNSLPDDVLYGCLLQEMEAARWLDSQGIKLSDHTRLILLCLGHAAHQLEHLHWPAEQLVMTGIWVISFLRHGHTIEYAMQHAITCQHWYQYTFWKLHSLTMLIGYMEGAKDDETFRLSGHGTSLRAEEVKFFA